MSEDDKYDKLPIPSYEEATSSRPSSSQSHREALEINDDGERQGLLGRNVSAGAQSARRNGNYHAPTVESQRSSYDSEFTLPEVTSDEDEAEGEAELRRALDQMEVEDPAMERAAQQRARLRQEFSKRFASLSQTFSNISLPRIPFRMPSLGSFRPRFTRSSSEFSSSSTFHSRVSWPIIARLVAIFLIASVVYLLVVVRIFPSKRPSGQQFIPEFVRSSAQGAVDRGKIESYLRQVSFDDHIAGTKGDFFLAGYIEEHFNAVGMDAVDTEDFQVYLNYPRPDGRRVAILDPPESQWQAALEEDIPNDSTQRHQAPSFHGLSHSGNVTGPLIYANSGSKENFDFLEDHSINLRGAIVIMRSYGTQPNPALKVKAAEEAGALGCLIYNDPSEDGFQRGAAWPEGPWRTPDSLQRTDVGLLDWVTGDVLTPGSPSTNEAQRLEGEVNEGLVSIPSLPIGWRDAKTLLESLEEKGVAAPESWTGGIPDLRYWTGDTSSQPVTVNLQNIQDESSRQPIRNVFGRIVGNETPEKEIYVGNHRDALCFGAADPGSGTAIMLETVRIFGDLASRGWRPRRSLVFASWDAGAINLMGSTEHVEGRIDPLRLHGMAYVNIAAAVTGHTFHASASPVFSRPLQYALDRVADPVGNVTLLQRWRESNSQLEPLGTSSDYLPFQALSGTSSIDLGFSPTSPSPNNDPETDPDFPPAFPHGSCYDTFARQQSHLGDPGFFYHAALTQVLSLLILELADDPILPFDLPAYATALSTHLDTLKREIQSLHPTTSSPPPPNTNPIPNPIHQTRQTQQQPINFTALDAATALLSANAATFMTGEDAWRDAMLSAQSSAASTFPDSTAAEPRELGVRRVSRNARMAEFETHLLDLVVPTGSLNPGGDGGGGGGGDAADAKMGRNRDAVKVAAGGGATGDGDDDDDDAARARDAQDPAPDGGSSARPPRVGGIPGRPQFKHVFFGPPGWGSDRSLSSFASSSDDGDDGGGGGGGGEARDPREMYYFPTIREGLVRRNWSMVQEEVDVVAGVVHEAAFRLLH